LNALVSDHAALYHECFHIMEQTRMLDEDETSVSNIAWVIRVVLPT
jgi:hypothetical protein